MGKVDGVKTRHTVELCLERTAQIINVDVVLGFILDGGGTFELPCSFNRSTIDPMPTPHCPR